VKKLFPFIKGYYKESILAPTFKMLEAIFELLVPLAVAQIIDVGIKQNDTSAIYSMFGVMIALGIIGLVCAISAQYFAARAAVGISAKIRSALFAKIQSFSYSMTDKLGISTLITRMTGDINSVQTGINMFLRLFMRSPFIVFGAMIMAFTIDVKLALIFAVTIPLLAVIVFGIMLISMPLYKKTQSKLDGVVSKVRGNYNGTRVVRAFNRENEEVEDFDEKNTALTKIQIFVGRISALMNPLTYVIINFAVIILIQNGAISVDSGEITQGELVSLYNYMSQILVELIKLANLIVTLSKAVASANRVSSVLYTDSDIATSAEISEDKNDDFIKFDNVSFKYNTTGDRVINNISFSVKKGQTVGIIGGTGSGKSTLINLIPNLYSPTSGSIFINGKNSVLCDNKELKAMVGIVPQKAVLFKGTVRSNMLWGNDEASDDDIWSALKNACADSFVREKEFSLDEKVEQNGSNFSGGQRQRLTIARALIKKPEILILDDSASALDYATESKLRKNIRALDYSPTVFIVSQRASSILHADLIIVLDDGELVGCGTHAELIESCDTYREIFNSQFDEGESEGGMSI
jgi:ABC-type multidrug transport system fused ATPase/permease subunit